MPKVWSLVMSVHNITIKFDLFYSFAWCTCGQLALGSSASVINTFFYQRHVRRMMKQKSVGETSVYLLLTIGLSGAGGFTCYSRRESYNTCTLSSSSFRGTQMPSAASPRLLNFVRRRVIYICVLSVEHPSVSPKCRLEIWGGTLVFGKSVHPWSLSSLLRLLSYRLFIAVKFCTT